MKIRILCSLISSRSPRWCIPSPRRALFGLLVVEAFLWLSDHFRWLPWHKGYAVLPAVAAAGAMVLVALLWLAAELVFRRRFHFSIRSLLVLILGVAVPYCWLVVEINKARKQKAAVEALWAAGSGGTYDDAHYRQNWFWPSACVARPASTAPTWLRQVLGDDFFHDVAQTRVDRDVQMRYLGGLSRIESLYIERGVSDAGMQDVSGLPNLKRLRIAAANVTDRGLKYICGLPDLRELSLEDCGITDAGLECLQSMDQLCLLKLRGGRVTEAGAKRLQRSLPNCRIEWTPPTKEARQGPASSGQLR